VFVRPIVDDFGGRQIEDKKPGNISMKEGREPLNRGKAEVKTPGPSAQKNQLEKGKTSKKKTLLVVKEKKLREITCQKGGDRKTRPRRSTPVRKMPKS